MKVEFYIILVIALLFSGCERTLLSEKSKDLQPYRENDILIFRNTHGQTDTITIAKLESYVNPTDPLDVFPTETEVLFVSGEISTRKIAKDIKGRPIVKKHIQLLRIESTKESDHFEFIFYNSNNGLKCPTTGITTDSLISTLQANSNRVVLQARAYYTNVSDVDTDLKAFEWDKDLGYTKFFYKNELNLELVEFIRNNKSLMN